MLSPGTSLGGTSAEGIPTRIVTASNGESAPVVRLTTSPSTVGSQGVPSPITHSTDVGAAGRVTVASTAPMGICQPEPITSHHHSVVSGSSTPPITLGSSTPSVVHFST